MYHDLEYRLPRWAGGPPVVIICFSASGCTLLINVFITRPPAPPPQNDLYLTPKTDDDDEIEDGSKKKKEKKRKKINLCEGRTIEKNLANIRNTTYDLSFDVDPLIQASFVSYQCYTSFATIIEKRTRFILYHFSARVRTSISCCSAISITGLCLQITTRQSDEQCTASMISYNTLLKDDSLLFDSTTVYHNPITAVASSLPEPSLDPSHLQSLLVSLTGLIMLNVLQVLNIEPVNFTPQYFSYWCSPILSSALIVELCESAVSNLRRVSFQQLGLYGREEFLRAAPVSATHSGVRAGGTFRARLFQGSSFSGDQI